MITQFFLKALQIWAAARVVVWQRGWTSHKTRRCDLINFSRGKQNIAISLSFLFSRVRVSRVVLHISGWPIVHCVAQASLGFTILLLQSPWFWSDKCKLPHLVWSTGISNILSMLGPSLNSSIPFNSCHNFSMSNNYPSKYQKPYKTLNQWLPHDLS